MKPPSYNPQIARDLIESAAIPDELAECEQMLDHAQRSAIFFMASSDRLEAEVRRLGTEARTAKIVALALLAALLSVVAGVVSR